MFADGFAAMLVVWLALAHSVCLLRALLTR
jgi:hypothetical protein